MDITGPLYFSLFPDTDLTCLLCADKPVQCLLQNISLLKENEARVSLTVEQAVKIVLL